MTVTSISIQKGGVGKTTVCRNLGEELSVNYKVLFIDNDPQGNLTESIFGDELPSAIMHSMESKTSSFIKVTPGISNSYYLYESDEMPEPFKINDNLYIIGSTKHLAEMASKPIDCVYEFKDKLEVLREEFDFIFIDCPPAAGVLQTAAHGASDNLIIPTELSEDSIKGVKQQIESALSNKKRLNAKLEILGVLINGKSSHKIIIEDEHLTTLSEQYGQKLFQTVVTRSVKISEARSFNKTIRQYQPRSIQAEQYLSLTSEYLSRVGVNECLV